MVWNARISLTKGETNCLNPSLDKILLHKLECIIVLIVNAIRSHKKKPKCSLSNNVFL